MVESGELQSMIGFFRRQIRNLYEKLDRLLPSFDGNMCGKCIKCCTAAARQKVSRLELDYIDFYIKDNNLPLHLIDDYEKFLIQRLELKDKSALNIMCPFYSHEKSNCIIYTVRPYSCRIYGNYSISAEDLPLDCFYRKHVKLYTEKNLTKVIPYCEDYGSIASCYKIYNKYLSWLGRILFKV